MRARWVGFQSSLANELQRFLGYKRALGRRYGAEEKNLRLLDAFLVERHIRSAKDVAPDLIQAFLASRNRTTSFNNLLGVVRRFFEWLVAQDYIASSPVRVSARPEGVQRRPFLLDAADTRRLLDLAGRLPDRSGAPFRGPVYRTAIALLSVLGLRVGEVSRLRRGDADFARGVLVIRESKFGKSRLVPFGRRMAQLLREYLDLRAPDGASDRADAPLFAFRIARPIHRESISATVRALARQLALKPQPGAATARPRAHDLRHAFAVRTLLHWYRKGLDPSARLLHLSTFLGHVNPVHTAVYLTITDELLDEAGRRFEQYGSP